MSPPRAATGRATAGGRTPAPPPGASAAQAPHSVRVIGGLWRGSKLPVAHRPGLRPTPDRVRETLFNWLGQDLSGWRCLDAFAGSGALGFEAASRGATEVLLIERDAQLARSLRDSAARLKATTLRVEAADAVAWMQGRTLPGFDLVLLDPPFASGLQEAAVQAAAALLVPGGWLYLESDAPLAPSSAPPGLALWRQGRAGSVHYHLLQRKP